eukprot:CAMPEP_0175314546 /NCGR_PEP_ID=MMETSP0093-20121207/68449_1 /TAXON_ID=311494 /ORGANISM="Alexandrium monilatum, Strain CCMP3105" /LENGTH=33 /DNA_ID= /DNA_START= /DNA_END= /DNA_ORIENTATION=
MDEGLASQPALLKYRCVLEHVPTLDEAHRAPLL